MDERSVGLVMNMTAASNPLETVAKEFIPLDLLPSRYRGKPMRRYRPF